MLPFCSHFMATWLQSGVFECAKQPHSHLQVITKQPKIHELLTLLQDCELDALYSDAFTNLNPHFYAEIINDPDKICYLDISSYNFTNPCCSKGINNTNIVVKQHIQRMYEICSTAATMAFYQCDNAVFALALSSFMKRLHQEMDGLNFKKQDWVSCTLQMLLWTMVNCHIGESFETLAHTE